VSVSRGHILGGVCVVLSAASLLDACAAPTEIRLRVHTNVPCTDPTQWRGVAIYAGAPGPALESKAPALTSTECDEQGLVGTLVVVPSGSKDDEVGLRVVGGISYAPEECAAHDYNGCIVARREVRFNRHQALDLDVALTSECVGLGCDDTHTCVAGRCAETQAVPPTPDAVADAGSMPPDPAKPMVRCGDNGVYCPTTGNLCCLSVNRDAGTTSGECKEPMFCTSDKILLACDDESDCTDFSNADGPGVCSVAYTRPFENNPHLPGDVSLAHCLNYKAFVDTVGVGLDLCQPRDKPCVNGRFPCGASYGQPTNPLPGYFWCQIQY
jgi:hypothetical protein